MNRGELRTEVLDIVATTVDDKLLSTTIVNRFINRAVQAISIHKDWSWLDAEATVTTVAGTTNYALPSDYLRTVSLTNSDNEPLLYLGVAEVDMADEIEAEKPIYFTLVDGEMVLSPPPTTTTILRHRYRRQEPVLDDDADVPLLPVAYHAAIAEYAAALCFRRQRNDQAASTAMDAYRSILDDFAEKPTQASSVPRIKTRAGGWMS